MTDWRLRDSRTDAYVCIWSWVTVHSLTYLLARILPKLLSSREGILRCGGDRSLRTHPAIGSRSVLGECQIDWISCEARAFWEWSVTVLFKLPYFNDSLIRWNWWLFGACETGLPDFQNGILTISARILTNSYNHYFKKKNHPNPLKNRVLLHFY